MFLSIFSSLYEIVTGENPDYPEYRESIFNSVGLLTLVISIVICLIFYVILGRWKGVWYSIIHWAITIVICAAIGFGMAFSLSKGELGVTDGYLIRFALFNGVYAAIYFIAFSFFFKNFSIFSKRTPF